MLYKIDSIILFKRIIETNDVKEREIIIVDQIFENKIIVIIKINIVFKPISTTTPLLKYGDKQYTVTL